MIEAEDLVYSLTQSGQCLRSMLPRLTSLHRFGVHEVHRVNPVLIECLTHIHSLSP